MTLTVAQGGAANLARMLRGYRVANSTDVRRWRTHLANERDGQALYRSLAAVDKNGERAKVWLELAQSEERHAARWVQKLREAGEHVSDDWSPGWRARAWALGARLFGVSAIAPIITSFEAGEADTYAAHPESQ